MHGLPTRSGAELIDRLRQAAEEAAIPIIVDATVTALYADAERFVRGVEITRPDGARDWLGCRALVLACNGYGGAPDLVAQYIPEMNGALYFGHPGNRGDAVLWGQALGAKLLHMSGYQGHGSVAHPHGILITWAAIMEGGFQVNTSGVRFSDESLGYSEQAAVVLAQPDGIAFDIFDERIAAIARQFEDFRQAEASGAVIEAPTIEQLAERLNLPACGACSKLCRSRAGKARGRARPFWPILRRRGAIVAAVQGRQSHRHAVSYPGRCCGRRTGSCDERSRHTIAEPVRRRRCRCRHFRFACKRLSVRQRIADCDRAWPYRRFKCGGAR